MFGTIRFKLRVQVSSEMQKIRFLSGLGLEKLPKPVRFLGLGKLDEALIRGQACRVERDIPRIVFYFDRVAQAI